jgi:anthranilate phosphoribosyltransferase
MQQAIRRLAFGESLSADEAASAFAVIMQGEASASQVAALLMGLRVKGETPEEVAGVARALRLAMVQLPAERPDELVDTCGTGGGALTTFNISTAAALVAAGAGMRVAKHGNRSFTSQCGSAEVLEALGVPIDASPAQMAFVLREAGIVFMYAPTMHPAIRHVAPVRREIAVPTVMNIVGPLANPAGAGRQVVGVSEHRRLPLLAGALGALGTRHALVVYGEPGIDEISPLGLTEVAEVCHGEVNEWTLDPTEYGLGATAPNDLAGGSPADNARLILELFDGNGPRGARAAVTLNAAAALYVGGKARSFADGVTLARAALQNGAGIAALDRMRSAYGRARENQ